MVLNEEKSSTSKVYSLSWSEFSSSLSATAQNLRTVEDLTDVTVSAGGKIYPAHKLVLSAASPLLMELLKNTKCQHPILMLAGISASDFELILDFIYRGEVNIDSDKLPSLLLAAKLLDIRALLPTALVLNSLRRNTQTTPTLIDKNIAVREDLLLVNGDDCKQSESLPLKRKAETKQSGSHPSKITKASSDVGGSDIVDLSEGKIDAAHTPPSPSVECTTSKLMDADSQEASGIEEKKIISDLPVNCKFCGVTIRQSRNLRRHIDQMHSKMELKSKNTRKKSEKPASTSSEIRNNEKDTDVSNSPLMTDFSEDSFSQLTEDILSYSAGSESEENSFPSTIILSSTSVNDPIRDPPTSSVSTSSSSIANTRTLPTLLEDDLCFQLSTKSNGGGTNSFHTAVRINPNPPVVEQFACSHLDDSCHVNDIALKELENQLFSACFCSTENM